MSSDLFVLEIWRRTIIMGADRIIRATVLRTLFCRWSDTQRTHSLELLSAPPPEAIFSSSRRGLEGLQE